MYYTNILIKNPKKEGEKPSFILLDEKIPVNKTIEKYLSSIGYATGYLVDSRLEVEPYEKEAKKRNCQD